METTITLRSTWAEYSLTRPLRPKTLSDHWSKLERCVPEWLDLDMNTISKSAVVQKHRALSVHPTQANCVMRIVRTLFNFAIATYEDENEDPLIKRNPVLRLSQMRAWNKERARDRHVPLNKIKPWMDAVLTVSSQTMSDYLVTLVLTGLRKTEAASLEWSNVDLDSGFIYIPETKNGNPHQLPLTSLLTGILYDRSKQRETEFVFPAQSETGYITSPYKAIEAVTEKCGVKFSPHDLRRTTLLMAEHAGVDEFTRKRIVNHTFADVTGKHYSIKDPERLRPSMQAITDCFLELAELN